eukprot:GHVS01091733.1.p1 GENE.GHVS01091733.1~~GHVS01091733.1.p1  ORF type:complete len:517 (+),score=69.64 GHVS01091733.1:166-1716(+)
MCFAFSSPVVWLTWQRSWLLLSCCWNLWFTTLIIFASAWDGETYRVINSPRDRPPLHSFQVEGFDALLFQHSLLFHLRPYGVEPSVFKIADYNRSVPESYRIPVTAANPSPLGFEIMRTPMFIDILVGRRKIHGSLARNTGGKHEGGDISVIAAVTEQIQNTVQALTQQLGGVCYGANSKLPSGSYLNTVKIASLSQSSFYIEAAKRKREGWFAKSGLNPTRTLFAHRNYGGYAHSFMVLKLDGVSTDKLIVNPFFRTPPPEPDPSLQRYALWRVEHDFKGYNPELENEALNFGFWKDISGHDLEVHVDCGSGDDESFCDSFKPLSTISPPKATSAFAFLQQSGSSEILERFMECARSGQASGDTQRDEVMGYDNDDVEDSSGRAARLLFISDASPNEPPPRLPDFSDSASTTLAIAIAALVIFCCCFVATCFLACALRGRHLVGKRTRGGRGGKFWRRGGQQTNDPMVAGCSGERPTVLGMETKMPRDDTCRTAVSEVREEEEQWETQRAANALG